VDLPFLVLHTPDVRIGLLLCAAALLASPATAHESASARLDALSLAISLSPDDARALLQRADEHRRLGLLDEAHADLVAASAHGAEPADWALQSALLALSRGTPAVAADLLAPYATSTSAPLQDARAEAATGRAPLIACDARLAALDASPDTARALAAAETCAEPAPDRLQHGLARAEQRLGLVPQVRQARIRALIPRDSSEALSLADDFVRHAPGDPAALLLRGSVHESAGFPEPARADRIAALSLAESRLACKGSPLRRLAVAEALLSLGRGDEAREHVTLVLADVPGLAAARALLVSLEGR